MTLPLTKICFKCSCEKPLSSFHKHKMMKDGHLNKCSACVVKNVAEWRLKNPDVRKKEHAKIREKKNLQTREEYLNKIKHNAKGKKAVSLEHSHKRRLQISKVQSTELDEFVFTEAVRLRDLRKETTGINWHVDHIVPINHKEACGLHNAFNIQVVPAKWNVKKGNRNMNEFFSVSGY